MSNIALKVFWSNEPMPLNRKIDRAAINVPFGVLITHPTCLIKSVNGKVGDVVLNAADVGADAAGSAEAVQQNLNTEVDTLNSQLDSLLTDLNNLSGTVETKASTASVLQALSTKADLINGVIPAAQLPSFVDDVLEYDSWNQFPSVGEAGKIYVDTTENKTWRWLGSTYVIIGGGGKSLIQTDCNVFEMNRLLYMGTNTYNRATNGYSYLPNGVLLQWGVIDYADTSFLGGSQTDERYILVNFPLVFPNATLNVQTCVVAPFLTRFTDWYPQTTQISASQFYIILQNWGEASGLSDKPKVQWMAIGY